MPEDSGIRTGETAGWIVMYGWKDGVSNRDAVPYSIRNEVQRRARVGTVDNPCSPLQTGQGGLASVNWKWMTGLGRSCPYDLNG